jgi:drug/metabolite transporter (DMT)-like permease
MPSWAGDAMALGCALAWAGAMTLFRRLGAVEAAALNLFKNALALALLSITMIATGVPFATNRSAVEWAMLGGSGVLGLAIADTMFLAGLRRIDASIAAVCDCAYSPTVVILSAAFLGEQVGGGLVLGGGLVVVGLFVVSTRARVSEDDDAGTVPPRTIDYGGVVLATAGVMTTALGVVLAKPVLDRSSVLEATTVRLAAGTGALLASQLVLGKGREALVLFRPQPGWRVAIPATLLGTYVSMLLWLGGMKYGTASRSALLNQMGAIFVLVLSRFSGEVVPLRRWIGAAIAVAGVCVVIAG